MIHLNKNTTVCFSGYRPKKFNYTDPIILESISIKLAASIFILIDKGYDTFLFGGAPGFDILAARAVNYAKIVKKDIRLICVLPYRNFHLSNEFNDFWRRQYSKIITLGTESKAAPTILLKMENGTMLQLLTS